MELNIDQTLQQAIVAHQEGKLVEAEKLYQKILEIKPDHVKVYYNLSDIFYKLKKFNKAEISIKKAIELKPDFAEAYYYLGIVFTYFGRFDEIEKNYKKAIELKPDFTQAHYSLGILLFQLNRLDEAEASYKKVIKLKPDYAEAYSNLAGIMKDLGRFEEAEASYNKAIELKPDYAEAYSNLAGIMKDLGRLKEAKLYCRNAIELKPDYAEAHYNLGIILYENKQIHEAEISIKKAIKLKPDFAEAYYNLGVTTKDFNNLDKAYMLKPDMDFLLGALIHLKMNNCFWDDLPQQLNELIKKIENGEKVSAPWPLLSLLDDPGIHKKAAIIFSNDKLPRINVFPKIQPYHHEKIKIGYFSADFMNHPTSYLTAELYENHDRKKFEVHAFSFGDDCKDAFNIKIKASVDYFHNIELMSDHDVVKFARSLEIDIAIDLMGYTKMNRTKIFAMSVAPIQVNYLGYPGTMGGEYIDYLIADHTLISKENQHYYSEKIVYMPYSYQPNTSKRDIYEISLTKKELGLPEKGFIFCCFNTHYKITATTFAGWMRILNATSDSVLWLFVDNAIAVENLKKEAVKFGINKERLIFAKKISNKKHLKRIQLADLFLDTLPCNAHTTASDALKMGLPILTCEGNSFASRVASSLLKAVKLPELITSTQDEYEKLAIELARNTKKLKNIKDRLINNFATTELFDISLYTKHLEIAYTIMYKQQESKLNPNNIEIDH
jgi:protein O-GlcNAc transferase